MPTKLQIKTLPNQYLLATVQTVGSDSAQIVMSHRGKPLKFINVGHIKEFFAGERIDQVSFVDEAGREVALESW